MKPIITIHPLGSTEEPKKFEGYITAAFWLGGDHAEGETGSVKVRQPVESYDNEVASLTEFTNLMVQRQINFAVEVFTEPTAQEPVSEVPVEMKYSTDTMPEEVVGGSDLDFEAELTKMREEYKRGAVTKKQYDAKKGALLKRWKETVEGTLKR